jgi:hypothetical protein
MSKTVFFRGEGGNVWEVDWPLTPLLAEKVRKGLCVLVSAGGKPIIDDDGAPLMPDPLLDDGSDDEASDAELAALEASMNASVGATSVSAPLSRPTDSAAKGEWVAYAVSRGEDPVVANAATKAELIAEYGA